MPKSIIRLSSSVEKNLHSSCTGQKWLIFLNKNNDLLVADIMVGATGFEPATPTPPVFRSRTLRGLSPLCTAVKPF